MILFRYLAKEVGLTLIALTSILVLIFMSNQVVIYLNRAASGVIPGMLVMQLMVLELPNLLSLLLPLGFYFALLLAYGRLYADSEMVVLQACGYSSGHLLKHSFILAFIVAIITALMISLSPLIAYQRAKLLQTTGLQTIIQ
ncbi:MAG TPA: LptF/LptG family permease, partial [Legionellaceae bacterium]|nr:LptF/LptG family permease [Legionellaceae bacterium]